MPYIDLRDIKETEKLPGFLGRFLHSEHTTVGYWNISAGASLPEHAHSHEQITSVIEGEFAFTLEGETRTMRAGSIAVIPANAKHSARALTNCYVIDVFYPVREDYR
jgi:quercetin dioxygenase-like cupin family protein